MIILKSLASAFLMYSKIPMPKVEWREENRRYSLCFFPLVGAVIGAVFLLWRSVCALCEFGIFLTGAVSVLIPILITGGIHLDGFCDVADAVSSRAEREKKLAIMSDPHIGAFAVISLCAYLILQTALLSEAKNIRTEIVIALGFVLSRALSALTAVNFKSAKKDGALSNFTRPAHKRITVITLSVVIAIIGVVMLISSPLPGGLALVGASLTVAWYRYFSYKNFGGITGDLAGWFLQVCEITLLVFAVAGEKIAEVLT